MTLILQKSILCALFIAGAALGIGLLWSNGLLVALGTYFGWFAATASMASYFILLVLLVIRGRLPSWGRICSINMGLSLLGIWFLLDERASLVLPLSLAIIASVVGFVAARLGLLDHRGWAIWILTAVVVIAFIPLQSIGTQILLAFGVLLIVSAISPRASQLGPNRLQDS